MPTFFDWFWPIVSLLLSVLWLWTLLRWRRAAPVTWSDGGMHQSVEAEDALKAAYALQEARGALSGKELAQSMGVSERLGREIAGALIAFGWAEEDGTGGMHLTEAGRVHAQELIRAHRLWERYLVDREGVPVEAAHAEAHRREHQTTVEETERLDAELGYPAWDPHGHAIPARGHPVPSLLARPLPEAATPGSRLRIICLDDEPAALLAQLMVLGLRPGVDVKVLEREPELVRLCVDGSAVPLATAAARHVFVLPASGLPVPLKELPVGSRARVVEIQGRGRHQRRMLDMGFVPGAKVTVVRKAPLGDPLEYHVKGTDVALRRRDANTILVEELADG